MKYYYIILAIIWILVLYNLIIVLLINYYANRIRAKDKEIIELFFAKINKIPALVEIMKKYTNHPDIFEDTIYIHKLWIIRNIKSVEDLRELNFRLHREFQFLMQLSTKIRELHRDGNFLYIRNYVIFYENSISKLLKEANINLEKYNMIVRYKNLSIIWILIPYKEKIVF